MGRHCEGSLQNPLRNIKKYPMEHKSEMNVKNFRDSDAIKMFDFMLIFNIINVV